MDQAVIRSTLPNRGSLHGLAPYQRKEIVERLVEAILDAIAAESREPDDWEAADIAAALGLVAGRAYFAALAYADRAMEPPEQRAKPWPRVDTTPTIDELRHSLEAVRLLPAPAA